MKLRRLPDAVEVLLEGVGPTAKLVGSVRGNIWTGEFTPSQPSRLAVGPQAATLSDAGFQSIRLDGAGSRYRLSVVMNQGLGAANPVVSNDGSSLILRFPAVPLTQSQTGSIDLSQPGRLPQQAYVPSFRPRAVAPPVGDMAVGSMVLRNRGFVQLSGPPVTITARGANPRDLLMALAQMGGYGFAFSADGAQGAAGPAGPSGVGANATSGGSSGSAQSGITVSFRNESFARAFNFVLLSAGLQAKVEDRTILVGTNVLGKTLGNQMSKVFRLNQVSPSGAADYLANLGAQVSKTNTTTITSNEGSSTGTGGGAAVGGSTTSQTTSQTTTQTYIEAYGASTGPLLGLKAVSDSRLGTITLVGDPNTIAIAEGYLRQLDLRKRQVAIEVKIVSVDLGNDTSIVNSAFYKSPNGSWFISKAGRGLYQTPGQGLPDAMLPGQAATDFASATPNNTFLDRLEATINSTSAKTLASPTLLVQEGSAAKVESVVSVNTNVTQSQTLGGNTICSLQRADAGLLLPVEVSKIDDNGFITMAMKPEVSIPLPAGTAQCGGIINIFNIAKRQLDSGTLRLRDGQTLVLTGVLREDQRVTVDKVPVLGDLPLIGQFFRGTASNRQKSELVILATPRIVRDDDGGSYGYGVSAQPL
jgi:type IV pilus assembly protein PilQ